MGDDLMIDPFPANERPIRYGGLMRCCIGTIQESTQVTKVGDTLSCKWEIDPNNQKMIVALDGVWEWNHPEPHRSA